MSIVKSLIGSTVLIGGLLIAKRIINRNTKMKKEDKKEREEFNKKWDEFRKKEKAEAKYKEARKEFIQRCEILSKKNQQAQTEIPKTSIAEAFMRAKEARNAKTHMKNNTTIH